jgi:hypothetical protein
VGGLVHLWCCRYARPTHMHQQHVAHAATDHHRSMLAATSIWCNAKLLSTAAPQAHAWGIKGAPGCETLCALQWHGLPRVVLLRAGEATPISVCGGPEQSGPRSLSDKPNTAVFEDLEGRSKQRKQASGLIEVALLVSAALIILLDA